MIWKVFLILLFVFGCDESQKVSQPVEQKIYSIACEGPDGWVIHKTFNDPYDCYGGKSGVWRIITTESAAVYSNNCYSVVEEGNENE